MFCESCGAKNDNNSCFCEVCGARLDPIKRNISEPVNQNAPNYTKGFTGNEIFQKAMRNKKVIATVLVIAIVAVITFFATRGTESSLLGTWELRSITDRGTHTYEAGEGDQFTLGKDGVIIDSDYFFGYEFAYYVPVDVISWDVEGDTLIFYTEHREVEYVPYKLSGKTLTLYFSDERSAVLHKIK